ncbi:CPBP family intramembrane glutamic endopeptidase [Nocardioides massiliensis]|uniref:Membrane protease YdiL (CAAX protease family) n=1 Tax=Nocardioides massiliensis TaxID=1325935 RepID=A0ABT9NQ25_9ACTN|nr:type II CAAX endopeptidase family protein [Nocardioides massiliensis]MDP9822536.1 membrane protease YdiL (CAAX protease family) [Nocardioides massiliensis]
MSAPGPVHQPTPTHPPPGGWAGPPGQQAVAGPLPVAAGREPAEVAVRQGEGRGHPHPEPREYHRMLRTWNYAWWRPTVGVILVAVLALVVAPIVVLPVLAVGIWLEGGPFWDGFERALLLEEITPSGLLYLNLVLGAMILVTWLVIRLLHGMRPRWLTSVVPKMRWKFLAACLGISVVALVAQVVAGMLVPGDDTLPPIEPNPITTTTVLLGLVVILTTPLQAAGEEYVFRGYLLQAIGAIFTNRWVTIFVTALLFAFAHGAQNFPLFFDRFMFGFIAAWLVIRTGGLEAGIALHVLNNILAFGVAILLGNVGDSLNVGEISWWNIPVTLTQAGVYAVLVVWVARRMGVQRTTTPPRFGTAEEPRVMSPLGS